MCFLSSLFSLPRSERDRRSPSSLHRSLMLPTLPSVTHSIVLGRGMCLLSFSLRFLDRTWPIVQIITASNTNAVQRFREHVTLLFHDEARAFSRFPLLFRDQTLSIVQQIDASGEDAVQRFLEYVTLSFQNEARPFSRFSLVFVDRTSSTVEPIDARNSNALRR